MLHYYSGSNQIPGTAEEYYTHDNPIFGESTTDPTFYEPTASRIANMKKAAGGLRGIYDFNDSVKSPDEALNQLSGASVDVRFSKHGMTKEEISQVTMEKSLQADSMISKKKSDKKDNTEQLKKELEVAEYVASKMAEKEDNASDSAGE